MNTTEFKVFVDGLLPAPSSKIGRVDDRIRALLPSTGDQTIHYRDFLKIGKGLLREQLLNGVDNRRYVDVVDIVHNHLGWNQQTIRTYENDCWKDVIAACGEEMPLRRTDWLDEYDKEHRRAAAAKRLQQFGVRIKIEDFDYQIENEDIVYDALTNWIREAGGRRFLKLLLSQLEYLESEGRFLTDMNGNIPNPQDVVIIKPYNYLVNIALANILADGGSNSEAERSFTKAVELATDFCFVKFPVQNFGNVWNDLFHRDRDAVEFFTDLVYKESVFGLTQHSKWFSKMFCERVLRFMHDTGVTLNRAYSFEEYDRLMHYIMTVVDPVKCVEVKTDSLENFA